MKKHKFPLLVVLGICLILISVFLLLFFQIRLHLGVQHSHRILSQMNEILPERTQGVLGTYPNSAMPVLEIDGVDYVATVEIPSFGITLPVADPWDSDKLYRSPARFFGSAYDGTLIVGGVDHSRQFGFCDKIQHGATIIVTDLTGAQFTYTVSRVDRAKHAETQWLKTTDYDLTLFCHDVYSMEYIAVRCLLSYR